MNRIFVFAATAAVLTLWVMPAGAETLGICGDPFVTNGVGPFDYLNPEHRRDRAKIPVLERHHFNADVQAGRGGQSTADALGDLDYILKACPNHHRALYTVVEYYLRKDVPDMGPRSASCYFDRAMRFRPDDGTVRMLHGIYLAKLGRHEEALARYREGLETIPNSAELHYNIGLLLTETGDFEAANRHANVAYSLGYPLPGLQRKLTRLGHWQPLEDVTP